MLAPERGGAHLAQPAPRRLVLERLEQCRAQALSLRGADHAEGFEPHFGLGASKLAFERAAEHVAGEAAVGLHAELQMALGIARRGGERRAK